MPRPALPRPHSLGNACRGDPEDPHGGRRADEIEPTVPAEALRRWRCFLFGIRDQASRLAEEAAKGEKAHVSRRRISRKKALQVLAEGGRLPEAGVRVSDGRLPLNGVVNEVLSFHI